MAAPVQIESTVDHGRRDSSWKYVRVGQRVELHAPKLTHIESLRWFELTPTTRAVDNTQPTFHFEAISYDRAELSACRDREGCAVDTTKPGPRAFQLELTLTNGERRASPGVEATEFGGLGRAVHKVIVRKDDSYLGFLTELLGTPYIFGSSGNGRLFQPDLLIGSDCADLVVYGLRRQGLRTRYTSSFGMEGIAAKQFTAVSPGDARGARVGDVLHFPNTRHVGVLYEDRPPVGVLDAGDLLLHTCWAPATIEPLSETSCASWPINVLRFDAGATR